METVAECLRCLAFYKVEPPEKAGDVEQQPKRQDKTIKMSTRTEKGFPCPKCKAPLRIIRSLGTNTIYLREEPRE